MSHSLHRSDCIGPTGAARRHRHRPTAVTGRAGTATAGARPGTATATTGAGTAATAGAGTAATAGAQAGATVPTAPAALAAKKA